jgi:ribonuclease-3
MNAPLPKLEQTINYIFKDQQLLRLALTHRSAHPQHNERLEFIGDSILNFIIGEALYHAHPQAPEGELSRWRAALVQGENLAKLATTWELDQFIVLGPGEQKTQGQHRPSILANAFEAILGAVYLDSNFMTVQKLVQTTFAHQLADPHILKLEKDAKTKLQEYLQAKNIPLASYELISTTGLEHASEFLMRCKIEKLNIQTQGQGTSKRRAEQAAATNMLAKLKIQK